MKQLKDMAYASRSHPQERLALYVELLEAHVKKQEDLLARCQQVLDQIIIITEQQS